LIKLKYELVQSNGSPYDLTIYDFDSVNRIVSILNTNDNSLAGIQTLYVRAKFDLNITLSYYVESLIVITIRHSCVRNLINAPSINERFYYELTDPPFIQSIHPWQMNMTESECG